MSRFAIDPSTLLRLVTSELGVDPAHQLVAAHSVRSDALDLLLGGVRRGELQERVALALHERMTGLKVRLLGDRVSRRTAWQLAMSYDWLTIHTAEYLAVAKLQADALVTEDALFVAKAGDIVRLAPITEMLCD
jgi:predicted nucleic acid-binding protein